MGFFRECGRLARGELNIRPSASTGEMLRASCPRSGPTRKAPDGPSADLWERWASRPQSGPARTAPTVCAGPWEARVSRL